MAKTYLNPIRSDTSDFDKIEKEIIDLFKKEIYLPLIAAIGFKQNKVKNSTEDLLRAIQDGQIVYYRGKFKGRFTSALSRELLKYSAVWDKKQGAWLIPQSKLPIEVRNAIHLSVSKFEQTIDRLDKKLKELNPANIADKLNIKGIFDTTLFKIEKDFQKSVANITVAPEINKDTIRKISDEYETNMRKHIVKWTEDEIISLRGKVKERVFSGYRYEGMIKTIQESYGVSENKAKFLARQETKLMTVKYKEDRYLSAGITDYVWVTTRGSNARESHQSLNGKTFSFLNPPVTSDRGTPPRHNNPGEDYNCYCVARPIIDARKIFLNK